MRFSILILCFLFSVSSAFAAVSIKSEAAQSTYEFWRSQKCDTANKNETQALEKISQGAGPCLQCLNASAVKEKSSEQIDELNEKLFFNFAAAKQVDLLNCHLQKLKIYSDEKSDQAKQFRTAIVNDIAEKLPRLRDLHQQIEALRQNINDSEHYLGYKGATKSGNKNAVDTIHRANERMAKLLPYYAALYESLWSADEPNMAAYLRKIIESDISPEEFSKRAKEIAPSGISSYFKTNFSFNDAVLKQMQKSELKDLKSLTAQAHKDSKGETTYELNQASKELIVKRGDTLALLSDSGEMRSEGLKGLVCRLDARYGQGTEDLSNAFVVGSLFLGGSGALLKSSALAKMASFLTVEDTTLFSTTGRILMAASTGAAVPLAMAQIQTSCGSAPKSFRTDSCDMNKSSQFVSMELKELDQGNCLLNVALGATFSFGALRQAAKLSIPERLNENDGLLISAKKKLNDFTKIIANKINPGSVFKTSKELRGDTPLDPSWQKYSAEAQESGEFIMGKGQSSVYARALLRDHPQTEFLKSIGYEFNIQSGKIISVKAPTGEQVIDKIDQRLQTLVKSGKVSVDDILVPVRNFQNHKGELISLRFGEKIPEGFIPYDKLLTEEEFAQLISNGKFPLGEHQYLFTSGGTNFLHDLAHISAFLDHPDYMAAYRKLYASTMGRKLSDLEKKRIFEISEVFEYQNPKIAAQFDKAMEAHGVQIPQKDVTATEVEAILSKKSYDDVIKIIDDLHDHGYTEPIGGSTRDIHHIERGRLVQMMETPSGLAHYLGENAKRYPKAEEKVRKFLAQSITGMVNSRRLDLAETVREAGKSEVDKKSFTYFYYCLSGAFGEKTEAYEAFCTK